MTGDPRRRLEEAGRRPVPEPRPGFVAELEDRLVAAARARPSSASDPVPRPRWRRPSVALAGGAAASAAMLVIVLVVGSLSVRTAMGLELIDPVNVEVALVDGTTLDDPDGLLLPDGAVIRVGAGGSARVGDVVLGAGDIATIDEQRLRVDRPEPPTASVATIPTSSPTPTRSPPSGSPPSGTPKPTIRPATTPPPTPRPAGTDAPTPRPTPKPTPRPTPTPPRDGAPSASPKVEIVRLKLEARAVGASRIGVRWSGTPRAARYVLVATRSLDGAARRPVYPGSPIVGEFTRPPTEPLVFRVPQEVVEVRLLVLALSADGVIVGRSNVAIVPLGG